ncbi:hypothetical protein QFC19_007767 [Naganishia cerealis]|uniref:Uncharacterized protein n=1 Tax=Naganishia cerealis TaxID=610337 RepID=A0ACC2V757_9TREE|nr:hypothetical protein QFC19_007767 [Naganishia cerealis]
MNALSTLDRYVSRRRRSSRSASPAAATSSPKASSTANTTVNGSPLRREKVAVPASILASTDPVLGSEHENLGQKVDQSALDPSVRAKPKRRLTGFPAPPSSQEAGIRNGSEIVTLPTRPGHNRPQNRRRTRKGQSRRTQPRNRDRNPEEGWMTAGFVGVLGLWSDLWTVIFGPDEDVAAEQAGARTVNKERLVSENGKGTIKQEEVSASTASESEDDQQSLKDQKSNEQGFPLKGDADWVNPVTRAPDNPEDLIRQAVEADLQSGSSDVGISNSVNLTRPLTLEHSAPHRHSPNSISFQLKKNPTASAISESSCEDSSQSSTSGSGPQLPSSILTNSPRHFNGIPTLIPQLKLLQSTSEEGSPTSEKNSSLHNTSLVTRARNTKLLPAPLSVPLSASAARFSQRRSDPGSSSRISHSHHQPSLSITSIPGALSTTPFHRPKTLILDLDETLIHSTSRPMSLQSSGMGPGSGMLGISLSGLFSGGKHQRGGGGARGEGHVVEVVLGGRSTLYHWGFQNANLIKLSTIAQVSSWYTLVIFTASMQEYADPVIDWLDGGRGYFAKKLYRESCSLQPNGSYTKDLSLVEEDLSRVCFMDNSPVSYNWNKG